MWLLTIKKFTNSNVKNQITNNKKAQSCLYHIISNTFFKSIQNRHQNVNNNFPWLLNLKFILFFFLHVFVFSKFSKMITHF